MGIIDILAAVIVAGALVDILTDIIDADTLEGSVINNVVVPTLTYVIDVDTLAKECY